MDNKNDFALVRKPSSAVEKAAPGAKSILSGMVTDILAVAHVEDAKTLFIRGLTYYSDDGSAQDRVKAIKWFRKAAEHGLADPCLLYTSPSPRDRQKSRMPSS